MTCLARNGRWVWAVSAAAVVMWLPVVARTQAADSPLTVAIKAQDRAAIRELLTRRVDVNATAGDGSTALHWAVHHSDADTVERLLAAGAKATAADDLGVTPLELACTNGERTLVERLLKAGADPNLRLSTEETALMRAARTGRVEVLTVLLAHGADVNGASTANGQTALMWAAAERHDKAVRTLVEAGAIVNAQSTTGFTPLMFAARSGDRASAEILVRAGADVNVAVPGGGDAAPARRGPAGSRGEMPGATALLVATVRGNVDVAEFLLSNGANPNADGAGFTPLHWAAGSWESAWTGRNGFRAAADHEWSHLGGLTTGKLALVKSLLARGADPNARMRRVPQRVGFSRAGEDERLRVNFVGGTAFLLATLAGDLEVMHVLVAAGAQATLPTSDGTTPLMVAAGLGRVIGESFVTEETGLEAVKMVLSLGDDVHAVNNGGNTALHGAAEARWNSVARFLVEKGAALDAKNKQGHTPLYIAERTLQLQGKAIIERSATGDLLRELGAVQ